MEHCKYRIMDRCKKSDSPCTFSEHCFEPEEPPAKTNADHIRTMSDQELADFLECITLGGDEPWESAFVAALCACCPTVEADDEYGRHYSLHECDFVDGVCPHGDSILWWLGRRVE